MKKLYSSLSSARPDWHSGNNGCLQFPQDASTERRFSKIGWWCCLYRLILSDTHTYTHTIDTFWGFIANTVNTTTEVDCSNYNKHTQDSKQIICLYFKLHSSVAISPLHPKYPFHMCFYLSPKACFSYVSAPLIKHYQQGQTVCCLNVFRFW